MDHSLPNSPDSQELTKMKPSAEFNYFDVEDFPLTLSSLASSASDTSSTPFEQEKEHRHKSYDIQDEEYQALFSIPAITNRCNKIFYSQDDITLSPSSGETPKKDKDTVDELTLILVECMDRINTRSREMLLRKFYAEVEREERLERFIIERLRKSKVNAITELYESIPATVTENYGIEVKRGDDNSARGVSDSVAESSNKLERFKVKTFDISEEVLGDEKK